MWEGGAIKSSYDGEKEGIKIRHGDNEFTSERRADNVGHGMGRRRTMISIKRLWMHIKQKIKNWLQKMLI
ncbi:hypothetical protein L2E82_30891 [Cichorium intybus]|uniref:Uncharacterized protein n=1 Tax=Cichorium intybus TaxID=13427 RepID=A0ACB9D1S6_CICIN|nr:hypothetical protein L2E82_30891 [Cichorium intybus]